MFNHPNNSNYTRRILIAIIPSTLPTLIFVSYLLIALGGNIVESLFFALILSLINPITYIIAIFIAYTSYLITHVGKKILIQTFAFSSSLTIIPLFIAIKDKEFHDGILIYLYSFLGLTVLGLIISSLNFLIEKKYLSVKIKAKSKTI